MIRFENVCYRYESAPPGTYALDGVTLDFAPGELTVVLGANGSGKSTLARLCNGLAVPTSGSVSVDGVDASDPACATTVRSSVGMVFQHPDDQIVATSVEDDVAFGPENLGLDRGELRARVDRAIADVGLAGLERREPHLLSGGQKQRLAIAGALAMQPRYLVLDEPTSMIDAQGRHEVLDVLARVKADGRAIVLITHDVAEVANADRVVVLRAGAVAFDGPPAALLGEGGRLSDWGLEVPPVAALVDALRDLGAPIDAALLTVDDLVDALCP